MAQDNNLSRNHDKSLITGRFTPLKIVPSGTRMKYKVHKIKIPNSEPLHRYSFVQIDLQKLNLKILC